MEFLSETTVYLTGAVIFLSTAIVTGIVGVRKPPATRRKYMVLIVGQLAMFGGYFGMYQGWATVMTPAGAESTLRFVGYHILLTVVVYFIAVLIDLSRTRSVGLGILVNLFPSTVLVSWVSTGTTELTAMVVVSGSVLGVGYLLYSAFNSPSQAVSRRRWLVFTKLRNLTALAVVSLIVLGLLSNHVLGVTTSFSREVGTAYLDVVLVIGTSYIVTSEHGLYQDRETKEQQTVVDATEGGVNV